MLRPWKSFDGDNDIGCLDIDFRVDFVEEDVWEKGVVFKSRDALQYRVEARSPFSVSQVRLDTTNEYCLVAREDSSNGFRFDGISNWCSSPMSLLHSAISLRLGNVDEGG